MPHTPCRAILKAFANTADIGWNISTFAETYSPATNNASNWELRGLVKDWVDITKQSKTWDWTNQFSQAAVYEDFFLSRGSFGLVGDIGAQVRFPLEDTELLDRNSTLLCEFWAFPRLDGMLARLAFNEWVLVQPMVQSHWWIEIPLNHSKFDPTTTDTRDKEGSFIDCSIVTSELEWAAGSPLPCADMHEQSLECHTLVYDTLLFGVNPTRRAGVEQGEERTSTVEQRQQQLEPDTEEGSNFQPEHRSSSEPSRLNLTIDEL